MVEQAAGRGNQHIDAAGDFHILITEGNTANQQCDIQLLAGGIFRETLFNLRRQFAGRFQNQRARHTRAGAALFQQRNHGQSEGGGFAGAGLGNAEHILAFQYARDRHFLNRGWLRIAGCGDGFEDFGAKAQFGKIHGAIAASQSRRPARCGGFSGTI